MYLELIFFMLTCAAPVAKAVYGLLVIQALRPDRLTATARIFVERTLGAEFVHITEKELDLANIVETEVRENNPPSMYKLFRKSYIFLCL
jgi:hypothetical protein